jgi:hypothetical protein
MHLWQLDVDNTDSEYYKTIDEVKKRINDIVECYEAKKVLAIEYEGKVHIIHTKQYLSKKSDKESKDELLHKSIASFPSRDSESIELQEFDE